MGEPLYDPEVEQATIGAVLINPDVFTSLAQFLAASDFFLKKHAAVWETFTDLRAQGAPIDYLAVCNRLQESGQAQEAGGDAYISVLLNSVSTSINAEHYGRKVKEYSLRRRKLEAASKMAQDAVNPNVPVNIDEIPEIRPRYVVQTAADALKPQPPLEWIIDGIISNGSINLFYGDPGAKKTYSLISMAVCVASGKPWIGLNVHACKVLIVDEESGEKRLSLRIGATLRGELVGEETPLEYVSLAGFKLDDPNDTVILQTLIQERGVRLAVLDALADLMTGDENSKQDTQPVFNALRKIAEETGAAIVLIHHSNKLGGYRGSSAIKGAVDLMVLVESKDGSDYINFKSEKNRDGEATKWAAKATWIKEPETFFLTETDVIEKVRHLSKSQEYVIRYLTQHGPSPLPAIMGAADTCTPDTARKAVYALVPLEKVYRTNPDEQGQGIGAIYDLVKGAQDDK